jgi:hypothetical protein
VARAKTSRGLAIEDPARETRVVAGVRARARAAGLDPASVEALFQTQIEFSRLVQQRDPKARDAAPDLDLEETLRPAIGQLGDRIVSSLAELAPIPPASLDAADWAPVAVWLSEPERAALRDAVLGVRRASN